MEKLKTEEQKILSQFETRIDEIKNGRAKQLREQIALEVQKAGYCAEDWQCHDSVEAIFETLQKKMWYGDLTDEQVEYIFSWSWAAFLGGLFYTLGSKLYLWTLGFFVPFFNIFLSFYLGENGRRLSYRKGWESFDKFQKRQNGLSWIIGVLLMIAIGGQILVAILRLFISK